MVIKEGKSSRKKNEKRWEKLKETKRKKVKEGKADWWEKDGEGGQIYGEKAKRLVIFLLNFYCQEGDEKVVS